MTLEPFLLALTLVPIAPAAALSPELERRVDEYMAVEAVRHAHRTWPGANPLPKPPVTALLSRVELRRRVLEDLKKQAALRSYWGEEITAAQLEAEVARIVARSQDRTTLSEIIDALHDDAELFVEVIARPLLVERRVRERFAVDQRLDLVSDSRSPLVERSFDAWWDEAAPHVEALETARLSALEVLAIRKQLSLLGEKPPAPCAPNEWRLLPSGAPDARDGHVAVWTGTEMIVWGGFGNGLYASGAAYDPATDNWHPLSNNGAPPARERSSAVWTGSEMIVWGGSTSDGNGTLKSGGRYDPALDQWHPVDEAGAAVPFNRFNHTAVWTGTEMIVWGGDGATSFNTGGRYDPALDIWRGVTTEDAPAGRAGHTAIWTGDEMIVWGGRANNDYYSNDGARYHPSTDSWTVLDVVDATPVGRVSHSAIWTGSEMVVWGGLIEPGDSATSTGGRFSPSLNRWLPIASSPPDVLPSYGHTAVWASGEMIVYGGSQPSQYRLASGARYDLEHDSWRVLSPAPFVLPPRAGHTAVWTGTEMIVWGGNESRVGGRYRPADDAWSPTAVGVQVPENLSGATLTSNGSEVLVWGGHAGDFPALTNQGSIYDPVTDSWRATTIDVSTPSPRKEHTTIWSGTEFIVWGGHDMQQSFADGARYLPSTGTWTSIPCESNCPESRYGHFSVWTGSEMMIWGGTDGTVGRNGGALFNPSSGRWRTISTTGAPESVSDTPLWTGSQLLIRQSRPTEAWFEYQPASDRWVFVREAEALRPDAPVLVWTGREAVAWGRDHGVPEETTGGRLDPALGRWRGMTKLGALTPRSDVTVTPVGSFALLWGGSRSGRCFYKINDGALYDPVVNRWQTMTSSRFVPEPTCSGQAVTIDLGRWHNVIFWGGYPNSSVGHAYCVAEPDLELGEVSADDLLYADDPPLAFAWHSGPESKFKLRWGRSVSLSSSKLNSGERWLSSSPHVPSAAQWKKILALGKNGETFYWGLETPGATPRPVLHQVRPLRIAAVSAPTIDSRSDNVLDRSDPPPTIYWTREHNLRFRVVITSEDSTRAKPLVVSGSGYSLRSDSWTIPQRSWDRILASLPSSQSSSTIQVRVFAEDSLRRRAASEAFAVTINR